MDRQRHHRFLLALLLISTCTGARALTDPTRPYNYMDVPEFVEIEVSPRDSTDWRLNGIRIHGDNRSAILNGQMIREGEMIENARVVTINQTSVVLEEGDKRLVIRLLDTRVKKPVSEEQR